MQTKICSKCKMEKSLDEFYSDSKTLTGKGSTCKVCRIKYWKKYYAENIDSLKKKYQKYNKENSEKRAAKSTVKDHVRAGRLVPASKCQCAICGEKAREYHHPSYKKEDRLKVVPLCNGCHIRVHKGSVDIPPHRP